MKKFLLKIMIFSAVMVAYYCFEVFAVPVSKGNPLYMQNIKDSLLQNVPGPRMVFLGGSSLAFGLESQAIQDSLHVNVINCGLSAGLGLKYILDEATPLLRKGDIVVIDMEYPHLHGMMLGSSENLASAMLCTQFRNFNSFNNAQLVRFFAGIPTAVRMNRESRSNKQFYSASVLNKFGDVSVRGRANPFRPKDLPIVRGIDKEYGECFLQQVKRIEDKGCRVIIIPQPICQRSFPKEAADNLAVWLKQHGYPLAAAPEENVMADKYGYDNDNHMTLEGAHIFTQRVIRELKNALNS